MLRSTIDDKYILVHDAGTLLTTQTILVAPQEYACHAIKPSPYFPEYPALDCRPIIVGNLGRKLIVIEGHTRSYEAYRRNIPLAAFIFQECADLDEHIGQCTWLDPEYVRDLAGSALHHHTLCKQHECRTIMALGKKYTALSRSSR